jgi:hypothetical protein
MSTRLVYSSYHQEPPPFIHIAKLAVSLDSRDSCLNRQERHLYQIRHVHNKFTEFITVINDLRQTLLYEGLGIVNRTFLTTDLLNEQRRESEKGLYESLSQYSFLVEKRLGSVFFTTTTAGDSLYSALYQRFLSSEGETLAGKVTDFVTTNYGIEDRPFLYIPEYSIIEGIIDTAKSEESFDFSIAFEGLELDQAEIILEDIDHLFSYCELEISGKNFSNMEWTGHSLVEIEMNIWRGMVNYTVQLEDSI